jgi:glycosyltransferase involved in cell wall biosynthesis
MSDSTTFPRLLVATEFPPNAPGGGPAVVRQMLRGWPVEKLFWWSCRPDADQRFGQRVADQRVAAIPPRWYPHRRFTGLKSQLLETLWSRWAAARFADALKDVSPDVVWVIPHAWSIPPLAQVLSRAGRRFHVTVQDYMTTRANRKLFGEARAQRLLTLSCELFAQAGTRDATSHPMIADLRARTGRDAAQMLHAGLEAEDFAGLSSGLDASNEEIRIGYAGTILVEPEFEFFVRCMESVRRSIKRSIHLHLWGAHSYRSRPWFKPEWMEEHGNLPEAQLAAALRSCTWGFAPMSLDNDDPDYNHFSFPTKFISYLAAGLPVITLAHPQSSVAQMAAAYQVGLLQTRRDEAEFCARLEAALKEPDPRRTFRSEILRCARTEFDAARMRQKLWRSLGVQGLAS